MLMRKMIVGMVLSMLLYAGIAAGTTYYVKPDGDNNANGRSWETAFATIKKGVSRAQSGDTILVGDGVYTGSGNRDIAYGANITIRSANGPANCIIDCEEMGRAFAVSGNGNHGSISGFTITNASEGFAIYQYKGKLNIGNCIIQNNQTGGIRRKADTSITAEGEIKNCIIRDNSGEAIKLENHAKVYVYNSLIKGNINCTVSNGEFENCTIVGAKRICLDKNSTLKNCIIHNKLSGAYVIEHDRTLTVEYCNIENGLRDILSNHITGATLIWGEGNISSDPGFVSNDDYHLSPTSCCIDAGDPNGVYDDQTDIDGRLRVRGPRVDIGADETAMWHVDVEATGAGTGITREDAFNTVQEAIDAAIDEDEILVYPGVYNEQIDYSGKEISIKGVGEYESGEVIISAETSSVNVVTLAAGEDLGCSLSGVTITGGSNGIYCTNSVSLAIYDCIIRDNSNCGVYVSDAGAVEIKNNTIVGNSFAGVYVNSGSEPVICDCIIWDNGDDLLSCSATYSCIEDGDAGTGNISSNPLFIDSQNDDYHIDKDSPCIDAGELNSEQPSEVDYYGGPRLQGPCIDMGADEADPNLWIEPNVINVTLFEGQSLTESFTIGNNWGSALYFDIWPTSTEAMNVYSQTSMTETYSGAECAAGSPNEIVIDYEFSEPKIEHSNDYDFLTIEGLRDFEQVSAPIVPQKDTFILLPFGKEVSSVEVEITESQELPGTYMLAPAQKQYPMSYSGVIEPNEPDPNIYDSNEPWPGKDIDNATTQSKRGYILYIANLYPVQYKPKSGVVTFASKIRLVINLKDSDKVSIPKPTSELISYLEKKVDNPEVLASYSQPIQLSGYMEMMQGMSGLPSATYEYVIITNEELLKLTPEPWNFQRLRDSKIARGISATIVTTEWIYENYDGTRPDSNSDNQTKIRNFLIDAYNNWGTQYALLAGNKDIIPVRYFQGMASDMYYGCVEPNECTFDYNANGNYGQKTDGVEGGEVDYIVDIYVGRAAVETPSEVTNFVRKNLMYASGWGKYLTKVSAVGDEKGYFGNAAESAFLLKNHSNENFFDFDTSKYLYAEWPNVDFYDLVNSGVHIITHSSHSAQRSMGQISVIHLPNLLNSEYFFVQSNGCLPGSFGTKDCMAEEITCMEHGAFGAVMYSEVGPTAFFNAFWKPILNDNIMELGRATQLCKSGFPSHRDDYWEMNLFGDPEQQFSFGQPRDTYWALPAVSEGSVIGPNSIEIEVEFSAKILPAGVYDQNIIVATNDPERPIVEIPVTMTILQASPAVVPEESFESNRAGELGIFTPESMIYTLTNNGDLPISWDASHTENWFDVEPDGGSLDPNESIQVTVTVNSNAYDLAIGSHYDIITFTNLDTGRSHKRIAILNFTKQLFTEVFDANDFDLAYQRLTFLPTGSEDFYGATCEYADEFSTDPSGGQILTFDEYDYNWKRIDIANGKEVSLYGVSYDHFYMSGNGSIVFDPSVYPDDVSLGGHFSTARISGLHSWMAPWLGGEVSYKQISDRIAITFENVPDWKLSPDEPDHLKSFQVELFFDGRIRFTYLNIDLQWQVETAPVIVGLSAGDGIPPYFMESDLSELTLVHNIDGDLWYTQIQDAIDDADNGDEIVVYPGTYYGSIDFLGKSITVRSTDPNDWDVVAATVVDCNGSRQSPKFGFIFGSFESNNSILEGLTVTNGYGLAYYGANAGGAIYCEASSPTIRRCIFKNNMNDKTNNTEGGAIATYWSQPLIEDCKFYDNEARLGGAIRIFGSGGAPVIIRNCMFWSNSADKGGAIDNYYGKVKLINCTIADNSAPNGGGVYYEGSDPLNAITNSILWGNGDDVNNWPATYSCIQEGAQGTGNMSSDPCFANADSNDYHIKVTSPCINAGTNSPPGGLPAEDIDGEARIMGLYVDMGADEVNVPTSDAHQWGLDERSGTTAYDSVDDDDGTYSAGTPSWVDGLIGGAVDFNDTSNYFSVSSLDNEYSNSDTFTVAGWFKTSETSGLQTIVGQWSQMWEAGQEYFGWQVLVENNKVIARFGYGLQTPDITGTTPVTNDNKWHHFAMVRNGTSTVLYVDGEPEDSDTVSFYVYNTKFRIGDGSYVTSGGPALKGGPFEGTIDEVMIFDGALSAGEIEDLYDIGAPD